MNKNGFTSRSGTCLCLRLYFNVDLIPPEESHSIATAFLSSISQALEGNNGILLSFSAKSAVITFNTHRPNLTHSVDACKCAQKLKNLLAETVGERAEFFISITQGDIICGTIGTDGIRSLVASGECMDFALIFVSLGRVLDATILVTESVRQNSDLYFLFRIVDSVKCGETAVQDIFELVDTLEHASKVAEANADKFKTAFSVFARHDYIAAQHHLNAIRATLEDPASDTQVNRLLRMSIFCSSHANTYPKPFYRMALKKWQMFDKTKRNCAGVCDSIDISVSSLKPGNLRPTRLQQFKQQALVSSSTSIVPSTPKKSKSFIFKDSRQRTWCKSGFKLGTRGAKSSVYFGMKEDGAPVAIKEIPVFKQKCHAEEMLSEILKMEHLSHENIVSYLGITVFMGKFMIVMEFVSCGSLQGLWEKFGQLPALSVKKYVRDILRGLGYLHANEILHRDIRPANVLLSHLGTCKLSDFSFALSGMQSTKPLHERFSEGAAFYFAPETLFEDSQPKASEIWSVGILTFFLLSGSIPIRYQTNVAAMQQAFGSIGNIFNQKNGMSCVARDFVSSCLSILPSKRPTAEQFLLSSEFLQLQ